MFDAVLFDLDGTLLDSLELILVSYRHTLAAHGLPARSDEDILSGVGATLSAQFVRWGYADRAEELAATYIEHNLRVHDQHVRPFPGIVELVRELEARGVPLALVTSKRRKGGEAGLRALAGLGLEPSERITFVGDAIHDVDAGKAAGVHTIAVSYGAGKPAQLQGAHALVDEVAQLRALLLPD